MQQWAYFTGNTSVTRAGMAQAADFNDAVNSDEWGTAVLFLTTISGVPGFNLITVFKLIGAMLCSSDRSQLSAEIERGGKKD